MSCVVVLFGAAVLSCHAQSGPELAGLLSFEAEQSGTFPKGWMGGPRDTIALDDQVVHGGKWSVRFVRTDDSANGFSTITAVLPADFKGTRVQMRGYLKSEDVKGYVGLWMREDGDTSGLAFDNMQRKEIKGTNDWKEYSIELPVLAEAKQLYFGVLLAGAGKLWADDLQLLVDGKPVWQAPRREQPKTIIDEDHEFDAGSNIRLSELTKMQVVNLARLTKVWGFLKYHHPNITTGGKHWDYELFRVLPGVLAAADAPAANQVIAEWIQKLGPVADCTKCTSLEEGRVHLKPELGWLADQAQLGPELSGSLRSIHRNRAAGKQFYVAQVPFVGNPIFQNEPAYPKITLPDAGYQILAVARFWNMIQYWFPYRNAIGESWDDVLLDFLPRVALAKDKTAYQLELMALIARVKDTHANLWSSLAVRPPAGDCQFPVATRFVENRAIVVAHSAKEPQEPQQAGLRIGDEILELDGTPLRDLLGRWRQYYAVSNEPTLFRDIERFMTRGACGPATVSVRRDGETVALKPVRVSPTGLDRMAGIMHDRPGDTFQRLSDDVAYLKLSSVKIADVPKYIDGAAGTKGMIIDIRNYPSEFVVFALGSRLVQSPTEFVRFTTGDLMNPGAFHWGEPLVMKPEGRRYGGKIIILLDETSQSQAEYTSMALRIAPGAKVVGSTTAGADGNVSQIPLPGGFRSMISGIGVFYPDKRPTQRVGIVPDVEVRPTVAGIREGRDEVLEEGIREILGSEVPAEQIRKMARR